VTTVPDDADRDRAPRAVIAFPAAAGAWTIAWIVGSVVLAPIVIVATGASIGDDLSIPRLLAVAVTGWVAFLVALVVVSRRSGSGDVRRDLAVRFRPIDLIGIPVGVLTQLFLIPLVYVPLRWQWPETFSDQRLEERAQDLADRAGGLTTVLLVLIVVLGAPVVEELVYRGLLQRSLASVVTPGPALCFTALWFALIHFSPVEYPGLFVAGLVFGGGVVVTRRLGMGILTHAAFNACGLAIVLANR
jgi:membrane protease YdiL (CAAX protease family)